MSGPGCVIDEYLLPIRDRALKAGIVRQDTNIYELGINGQEYSVRELDMDHLFALEAVMSGGSYDIIVGPEYSFASRPPLTKDVKDWIIEKLKHASEGRRTLVIPGSMVWKDDKLLKNTAPVICDGNILLEYEKMNEETLIAECYKLRPHYGKKLGVFEWDGYECGLEICMDHSELRREGVDDLDLQFLVSCGRMPYEDFIVTRNGGYFLHSDGAFVKTAVLARENDGKFKHMSPTMSP